LIGKIGVDLHSIVDFAPIAITDLADDGIASSQNLAVTLSGSSAVSNGGTSIGRALRLRFGSLLI
jgi:hypothetical protein